MDKFIIIMQKIIDILNSGVGVGIMGFLVVVYQAHVKPQLIYGAKKSKTEAQRQSYKQALDIADKWVKYVGSIKGANNAERFAQAVQNTSQDLIDHNMPKAESDVQILVETAYQNAKIAGFSNATLSDADKQKQQVEAQSALKNNPDTAVNSSEAKTMPPVTISIQGKTYKAQPDGNGGFNSLTPVTETQEKAKAQADSGTTPKLPSDGSEK